MASASSTPRELIQLLINPEESEDKRLQNIKEAVSWILEELRDLKNQDQTLMRQFKDLRSRINYLKENGADTSGGSTRRSSLSETSPVSAKEFVGVHEGNLTPFDAGEILGMRRRAFSTVERVRKFSGRKTSADFWEYSGGHLPIILTTEESSNPYSLNEAWNV